MTARLPLLPQSRSLLPLASTTVRRMEPRRFELVPEVSPNVTIHVVDDRESMSPDDDLIEIGFRSDREPVFGFGVTLSLEEIVRLRDALSEVAETRLP